MLTNHMKNCKPMSNDFINGNAIHSPLVPIFQDKIVEKMKHTQNSIAHQQLILMEYKAQTSLVTIKPFLITLSLVLRSC